MGIDLATSPQSGEQAEVQTLARKARTGDKQAQLELGKRYEAGNGVRPSFSRARRLYRAAASDTGGTQLSYVPGINGSPPMTTPIYRGPKIPGLAEARERLFALYQKSKRSAK